MVSVSTTIVILCLVPLLLFCFWCCFRKYYSTAATSAAPRSMLNNKSDTKEENPRQHNNGTRGKRENVKFLFTEMTKCRQDNEHFAMKFESVVWSAMQYINCTNAIFFDINNKKQPTMMTTIDDDEDYKRHQQWTTTTMSNISHKINLLHLRWWQRCSNVINVNNFPTRVLTQSGKMGPIWSRIDAVETIQSTTTVLVRVSRYNIYFRNCD